MKEKSVMAALGLVMTLTTYGGGNVGTTAALSSGSETQAEAKTEKKTEAGTTGQEEKEESRTETSDDAVILKLSNNQPDGNCTTIAVGWLANQVRERMDGRINIEVYNNGTLGDAISCLEQSQYGGVDIMKASLSTMIDFVDEYNALMTPYMYKNAEHLWRIHGGDIGVGILHGDKTREKKLYGLTYCDGGTRCFYNTKRETHSPEDTKGMLVRVQQSELMMPIVEALGDQPVATAYSEMYSTSRIGVVGTVGNSIINYLDRFHSEVIPYFVEDHHTRSANVLVMGERPRGKLSAEDPKIIDDMALGSWEYQRELWAEAGEESRQKLLEQGVTIAELTEDELKAFQGAYELIWYSYEDDAYEDITDQIVKAGR